MEDFRSAYNGSKHQIQAQYETPFLAHATMEPQNVLVHVYDDRCEIWAPTQVATWAREMVANYLSIAVENITIHIPFVGGGFGRRIISDFILEGCFLSKKLSRPVKVFWTREEDMTQGPFRPGTLETYQAAIDDEGDLVALKYKPVLPIIEASLFGFDEGEAYRYLVEPLHSLYEIPNLESGYVYMDIDPIPVSWWRSVYHGTFVFGLESLMDELAKRVERDPFDFRLELLQNKPRPRSVLNLLREKSNWSQVKAQEVGRGIALSEVRDTLCALYIEVAKVGPHEQFAILKVIAVVDCGLVLHPENARSQIQGGIIFGLTASMKDPISFSDNKVQQRNFDEYRLLRIDEIPEIDVHFVKNFESPTGIGEIGVPAAAPALVNAIADLYEGKRLENFPLTGKLPYLVE